MGKINVISADGSIKNISILIYNFRQKLKNQCFKIYYFMIND